MYLGSLHAPFVFDDERAILENPSIRQLWPLSLPLSPPSDAGGVIGRPLVNLSLALNYALGGTSVEGYHWFNAIVHALNAVVLFEVLRLTFSRLRSDGEHRPRAAALQAASDLVALTVALLWAVHPLQTESVTCIVQRNELLVGFFYLATLGCLLRANETGSRRNAWLVLAVVACLAGMACKEVMVTAPFVVLLFDRIFVAGSFSESWRQRRSLYVALACTWILLFGLMAGSPHRAGTAGFGAGVSSWDYLLTQARALILYLRLSIWPHPLVVDYGAGVVTSIKSVFFEGVFVVLLLVATAIATVRRPPWGFLGAWFFLILAPSSSFVPLATQTMAEHRMYLPLAAVLTLLVVGAQIVFGPRGVFAFMLLAGPAAWTTIERNRVYASPLNLWSDTVARVPENGRAQINLGNALHFLGRHEEAIAHYEAAARVSPSSANAWINLTAAYREVGKFDSAFSAAGKAVQLVPQDVNARVNLGLALGSLGRPAEAVPHFEEALRIDPRAADAAEYLGGALLGLGRTPEAVAWLKKSVELQPGRAQAWCDLARAYAKQSEGVAARQAVDAALRLQPDLPQAWYVRANLDASEGNLAAAINGYRRAITIAPGYFAARNNLANALVLVGQIDEAISLYRQLLVERPGDGSVRENLNRALQLHN